MHKNNFFIITGAMGSGKSTILQQLRTRGYSGVDEPARQILAEQRSIDGDGVWDKDKKLFKELMLSRAIFQFKQMQRCDSPVFFDRGIPDNIAYADIFGVNAVPDRNAARQYRYNNIVFFMPAWGEIYKTDNERTMSFAQAKQFGDDVRNVYVNSGYNVIDIPCDTTEKRVQFILNTIGE